MMWALCTMSILSLPLLQIAAALSAGEEAIQTALPSKYIELYDKINDYLESYVEQSYVEYNMEAAANWLATLKASNPQEPLVAALELLTSLKKLKQDTKCSSESYSILRDNYLATGNRKLYYKLTNIKRTEHMVYYYCFQHAKQCKYTYVQNYDIKFKSLNKRLAQYVEFFANSIMYSDKYPTDEYSDTIQIYKQFLMKPVSINGSTEAKLTFETLRKLAENDSKRDSLYESHPSSKESRISQVRELYDKYIVKPCDYYTKQLGPDIFIPIGFDDLFQAKKADLDFSRIDFYHSWARYRLCEALNKRDEVPLFSEMIKVAGLATN